MKKWTILFRHCYILIYNANEECAKNAQVQKLRRRRNAATLHSIDDVPVTWEEDTERVENWTRNRDLRLVTKWS